MERLKLGVIRFCILTVFLLAWNARAAIPTFQSFNPSQFATNNLSIAYRAVWTNEFGIIHPAVTNFGMVVTNIDVYAALTLPAKVKLLSTGTNNIDMTLASAWLLVSPTNDPTQVILSLSAGVRQGQLAFLTSQNFSNSFTLPDLSQQYNGAGFVDLQGDWVGITNRGIILQYVGPDWVEMSRFDPGQTGGGTLFGNGTAGTLPIWVGPTTLSNSPISKATTYLRFAQPAGVNDTLRIADNALFPSDATQFLDGTGHWGTPTAGSVTATNAYNLILDEGAPLTIRTTLNFVGGGVTASDSGSNTVITIPDVMTLITTNITVTNVFTIHGGNITFITTNTFLTNFFFNGTFITNIPTINPTDQYIPYRFDGATVGDSSLKRLGGGVINAEAPFTSTIRDVSAVNIDAGLGNEFSKELASNTTLGIINMSEGQQVSFTVTNTTFTLGFTNTIGAGVNELTWISGIVPVVDTNNVNVFHFWKSGGRIFGSDPEQRANVNVAGISTITGTGVVVKTNSTDFTTFNPLPIQYGGTGTNSFSTLADGNIVFHSLSGDLLDNDDAQFLYSKSSHTLYLNRTIPTGQYQMLIAEGSGSVPQLTLYAGKIVELDSDLTVDTSPGFDFVGTLGSTNNFKFSPSSLTLYKNDGSTNFYVANPSGYVGTGLKVLKDNGQYDNVTTGGTNVIVEQIGPFTPGRIPYATGTNTLGDSPLLRGNAYTVTLTATNNNTPSYQITPANTNVSSGFYSVNLADSDGTSPVVYLNAIKNTGWGLGTPSARDGTFSINVLHDNAMASRFQIDGGSGTISFLERTGNTVNFSLANTSGYTGAGTLFLSDDGTYKSASGSGGYNLVQDEGISLTARTTLNFAGAGVTATDSGGTTLITIPGGGGATINATDGYLPYRSNATTFADSPWYRSSALRMGFGDTNSFLNVNTNGSFGLGLRAAGGITPTLSGLTAIGGSAMLNVTGGQNSIAVGQNALFSTSATLQDVALGVGALQQDTSGDNNTAVGYNSSFNNNGGARNVTIGSNAGSANVTGNDDVVIGQNAQLLATSDTNQIVIGSEAIGNGPNTATIGNAATVALYVGNTQIWPGGGTGGNTTNIFANVIDLAENNLGTIAGAGTATISINTNLYRGIFSGSTFNINLPTPPDATNGYWCKITGTNTSGATQIGTIKVATVTTALWREETKEATSTLTNDIASAFTLAFRVSNGLWSRVEATGDALTFPPDPIYTWTNDVSVLKPLTLTNKLWLSDVSPYVVRIDTGGAWPINDNDRLLEINNFQTNVVIVSGEGGIMIGRNTETFWNSIADNGEAMVSVANASPGATVPDLPFKQIYIGATNSGNMGFADIETRTNSAFVTVGQNVPKATLNGDGSLVLWDSAGTHQVRQAATASTTTNLNVIWPAAPNTGLLLGTLSAATNETISIAATVPAAQFPALTGDVTTSAGSLATTVAANLKLGSVGFTADGGGSVIPTGKAKGFAVVPYAATITGWSIVVDTGTAAVNVWKIASGNAHPTVSDLINTSGLQLTSGTATNSTVVTDFTSTVVTAGDIFAFSLATNSAATELTFQLKLTK